MDESIPFEVKYQNKTGILSVSQKNVECKIGNKVVFSIATRLIRIVDIPKRENLFAELAARRINRVNIPIFKTCHQN